jgi:MFS transporter, DHA1 family, multidrug resistance protein
MERWKINLIVLWFGNFFVMAGMTMVMPFLPLYIQELGVTDTHEVSMWAGIIFAANFMTSFFFQPLWGSLADRYGRKIALLRSGVGMAIVTALMGLATGPWHLLILRLLNGTISGFIPAAVALQSSTTPKEKTGFALGTLQSGTVAGTILGPLIGGLLVEWIGFRAIFGITGILLFVPSVLAWLIIKDPFNAKAAAAEPKVSMMDGLRRLWRIPQIPALFAVTLLMQFALLSAMPLIPLFVQELWGKEEYLAFLAGLVGSVTGLSNMIASPLLGRLGDKVGQQKILLICLAGAALASFPQAFVLNVWQLLSVRFLLGICMGGLLPSVHALLRKYTPDGMESRVFSFNASSLSLGNMLGPITGGIISGWVGIQGVFIIGAILLLVNAFWVSRTLPWSGIARSNPKPAPAPD